MDKELRERIKRKVKAYYGPNPDPPTEVEKKAFLDSLKESMQRGELHGPSERSDTDTNPFR